MQVDYAYQLEERAMAELPTYELDNAKSKIIDAIQRIDRHMAMAHEGKENNDLRIIRVQLNHALSSLKAS